MEKRGYTEQSVTIAQTDWTDKDSVGQCARSLWESRSYKSDLEERAYRNERFLWGKQWYWWDESKQDMVPRTDVAGWRTRLTFNETLTCVENRLAKLMRNQSPWSPVVNNADEIEKIRQRLQAQVMQYQWEDGIRMPKKMRNALQWAMSSAVVFARPFWNRRKGQRITVKVDDFHKQAMQGLQQGMDPEQGKNMLRDADNKFFQLFGLDAFKKGEASFMSGDVDVGIHPIFEMCWWPFEPVEWEGVRLWMWTTKKTVEEAAEEYKMSKEDIRKFALTGGMSGSSATGTSTTKWGDDYFWRANSAYPLMDDCVLVHTLYKPACDEYPNGRMGVVLGIGGHCVHLDDLNTPDCVTPIVPLVEKPIRGTAPGTCVVDQTIHAQEEINMSLSQIADYRNKRLMPTLVDFIGNDSANKQALSNAPGKIYKASGPDKVPQVIAMPDIGRDYFATHQLARDYMERLGGIASIDTGNADDAGVKSGRAILALREQNDLRLVPFGQAIDEWVEEIGNQVLALVRANTNDKRLVQIVGKNNELEVIQYRGSDLQSTGEAGSTQRPIRCRAFSIIPKNPTEMLNIINVLGNQGLLTLDDRNSIVDMLGAGEFRGVFDKTRADTVRQQQEIDSWEGMRPVGPPDESDDDMAHLMVMNKWLKGQFYRQLLAVAAMDQMAAMLVKDIKDHYDGHKANMARKIAEEQYLMLDANLAMWMKHKAKWMEQIAMGVLDPITAQIIMQLYMLPALGGMAGPQEGEQGKDDDNGGDEKKPKENKNGRMPNGTSPQQGVRPNEREGMAK